MDEIELSIIRTEQDYHYIYQKMMSEDQSLFSIRLVFNTESVFKDWFIDRLNNDFHDFYIIKLDDNPIGFVYDYDFFLKDGHCKIVAYIEKKYQVTGYGCSAVITFIDLLFRLYPLRKIYTTVYDYNIQSLNSNLRAGFVEEGYISQYIFYNRKYFGLHILSMNRDVFYKTIGRLL